MDASNRYQRNVDTFQRLKRQGGYELRRWFEDELPLAEQRMLEATLDESDRRALAEGADAFLEMEVRPKERPKSSSAPPPQAWGRPASGAATRRE